MSSEWMSALTVVSILSGIVLGWSGKARSTKQEITKDATIDAVLRTDVGYIRHSIDDVRMKQGEQGQKFEALTEKVIRIDESTKSAHLRIDELKRDQAK